MKKNILKLMMIGGFVALASSLAVSCSETTKGPEQPGKVDQNGNTLVVTETITPLRFADMKYNAGKEGVSIEVVNNVTNNFTFVCKPGSEVMSYRVNVYPLATLNNFLLNLLNAEKAERYDVAKCEEFIANMINNTESQTSGGQLISASSVGDEFANMEFDWMNSKYAKFDIKPAAEYIIVCQAYFDEEGKELPADLCMCRVTTPSNPVKGNPEVAFDVTTGYYSYRIEHKPNSDAFGYYYLSTTSAEIDQYIDAYGEEMYKQLLRHYGELVQADGGNHFVDAKEQIAADPMTGEMISYCGTALAVDSDMTASPNLNRIDFTLKEMPTNTQTAEGVIEVPFKVAASICQFNIELSNSALRAAYYVYPAATAAEVMKKPEEERKAIALAMVRGMGTEQNPGWVVVNPNYALDRDKGELTGQGYATMGWQHELKPATEYQIIYALMNGYGQSTDLKITDKFSTKALVKDRPQDSKEDVVMHVASSNRTAYTINAKFNSDNTARIYWQYYYPDNPGAGYDLPDPADIIKADENRKNEFEAWDPAGMDARMGLGKYTPYENPKHDPDKPMIYTHWLYWFLEWRDPGFGFPWPNEICDAYHSGIVSDDSYFDGFRPDEHTYFAYIAEDWNGVLGQVKFFEGSTKAVNPGDNPAATIKSQKLENGDIEVIYNANEDTRYMKYATQTDRDGVLSLCLNELMQPDFGGMTYEDFVANWTEFAIGTGLTANGLEARQTIEVSKKKFDIAIAMVLPVGGKNEAKPVNGELQAIVYNNKTGEIKTLAEFMGVKK